MLSELHRFDPATRRFDSILAVGFGIWIITCGYRQHDLLTIGFGLVVTISAGIMNAISVS